MRALPTIAIALAVVPAASFAEEGRIGVAPRGTYACELPGNAGGEAGIAQPDETFRIKSASRYTSDTGHGTYLRRGDRLIFTSGARKGEQYLILSDNFLRRIVDGQPGPLRCIRQSR